MKNNDIWEMWIPIFKGGKQVDANGKEQDGNRLIQKAIKTFDPKHHEPPVTLGHPKDNHPAYGWIETLKQEGNILYARFKQISDEFKNWVKEGKYKKISSSFYPDGRLRHVGFLGAAPPAVKGLDLPFSECPSFQEEAEIISFNDIQFPKEGGKTVDHIKEFLELLKKLGFLVKVEKDESEKDDSKKEETAKEDTAKEDTEKEFSEKRKEVEEKTKQLEAREKRIEAKEQETRKKEIHDFCDELCKKGVTTPASIKGLKNLMLSLDSQNNHDFSEDGKEENQLSAIKRILIENLKGKQIEYDEFAEGTWEEEGQEMKTLETKISNLAKKLGEEKDIPFSDAYKQALEFLNK